MLRHRHHLPAALPTLAVAAAGILLLSGCSGSSSPSSAEPHPSINYGSQASTTPGLAGNGTGGSASAPSAAGSSAPAAPVSGPAITINNFMFAPPTLTVPVGATVTWTNHDGEPHTVVAADGSFHSPGMDSNATFSFTFPKAGSFDYVCSIHPFMHGTVIVK